jgi:myo-inositol-1(or 4)-monophosphatase
MTDSAVSPREAAALTALAVRAADAAAAVIREAAPRRRDIVWQSKSAFDFVSEVDLAAEAAALAVLRPALPEADVLAEETATSLDDQARDRGLTVVIDPLDGTTNFLHGVPEYAVSIGILVDGLPTSAVVHHVPRGAVYTATAGGGAWCGDERLRVSAITDPARALVGTGFPFKDPADIAPYHAEMAAVMVSTAGLRRPGAASIDLAWVAAGHFDDLWEPVLAPWDVAAGILLVREAGGVVTDYDGRPSTAAHAPIVAGNPALQAWLLDTLGSARREYAARVAGP